MAHILVLYATTDGQTRKIAERIGAIVESAGHRVHLSSITDVPSPDPSDYDAVLVGASIRYGRHSPRIRAFVNTHADALDSRPSAFFSVNLVARKPGKDVPGDNPYLQRFLRQVAWSPQHLAVFAGRLDYPRYGFVDRAIIGLIMRITGGPTDPGTVVEYTDWDQVDRFAREIAALPCG